MCSNSTARAVSRSRSMARKIEARQGGKAAAVYIYTFRREKSWMEKQRALYMAAVRNIYKLYCYRGAAAVYIYGDYAE